MNYSTNREWSDHFIPEIKALVGPWLLTESPLEIDTQQATDLIVFRARDMAIAARVRRWGYADNYPNEFTIRSRVASGAKTELAKITEGWGDWMFYGHQKHPDEFSIGQWCLIDLHAWRCQFIREGIKNGICKPKNIAWGERSNGDGTSFCWFKIESFSASPPILIASSQASHHAHEEAMPDGRRQRQG